MSAKEELAAELRRMRDTAPGKPTLQGLVKKDPELKVSTINDWFKGTSVPYDLDKFQRLVHLLTGAPPKPSLRDLRKRAVLESRSRSGRGISSGSRTSSASPGGPAAPAYPGATHWFPRIAQVNYANRDRLNEILHTYGHSVRTRGAFDKGMMSLLQLVEEVVEDLKKIDVKTERLTQDFSLRSLETGDLLVFDRQVFTRNGPKPGDRSSTMSGDLDVDPLIWFKRGGVRVVMPIVPAFVTTASAYSDFTSGGIRMSGLCRVKRWISPADAPHLQKQPKRQLLASPLILGTTNDHYRTTDLAAPVPPRWDPDYRAHEKKMKKRREKGAARATSEK